MSQFSELMQMLNYINDLDRLKLAKQQAAQEEHNRNVMKARNSGDTQGVMNLLGIKDVTKDRGPVQDVGYLGAAKKFLTPEDENSLAGQAFKAMGWRNEKQLADDAFKTGETQWGVGTDQTYKGRSFTGDANLDEQLKSLTSTDGKDGTVYANAYDFNAFAPELIKQYGGDRKRGLEKTIQAGNAINAMLGNNAVDTSIYERELAELGQRNNGYDGGGNAGMVPLVNKKDGGTYYVRKDNVGPLTKKGGPFMLPEVEKKLRTDAAKLKEELQNGENVTYERTKYYNDIMEELGSDSALIYSDGPLSSAKVTAVPMSYLLAKRRENRANIAKRQRENRNIADNYAAIGKNIDSRRVPAGYVLATADAASGIEDDGHIDDLISQSKKVAATNQANSKQRADYDKQKKTAYFDYLKKKKYKRSLTQEEFRKELVGAPWRKTNSQ